MAKSLPDVAIRNTATFIARVPINIKRQKNGPNGFINKVDNQLRLNRKIFKEYNKGGKVTVRAEVLLELGFNPNFFTHYWKNQKGDTYFFVYEYGFSKEKGARERKVCPYTLAGLYERQTLRSGDRSPRCKAGKAELPSSFSV